jgi:DNA invertase Pin-like site-specific DNA recombinase
MRVSSRSRRPKSPSARRHLPGDYCKLYGYEVAGVYKDEAVSGTVPMPERSEGLVCSRTRRRGPWTQVLVYRLDRIGRSLLVVGGRPRQARSGRRRPKERQRAD